MTQALARGANALLLDPRDNVGVACMGLLAGERLQTATGALDFRTADTIPLGHKFALNVIAAGQPVIKFGALIGCATRDISPGQHVHLHNLSGEMGAAATTGSTSPSPSPRAVPPGVGMHFEGYRREWGGAGTRNFVGVLATVNCSVSLARMIAAQFQGAGASLPPGVDGVIALGHGSGCGMSPAGEGFQLLRRTLAGYARHPNFGGVLLLGLGCEQNQVGALLEEFGLDRLSQIDSMVIQDNGGSRGTLLAGAKRLQALIEQAGAARREQLPVSELKVGLQCGGSDGFSGISANPALGVASDLLVAQGGTAVLSETPEIIGAEHLLTRRAVSAEVARQLLHRVAWWRDYAQANGARLEHNPSPGNLAGGITTLAEKSLGAVAKSGSGPLVEVAEYAAQIRRAGVVFMDSPGYDPVAVTGQVAAGCNLVCFTTGRGSVFGCRPVPSLKLATNTALFERMPEDIDLNCGEVIDGRRSIADMGALILHQLIATASGERTRSEHFDGGVDEFVPWPLGAVL